MHISTFWDWQPANVALVSVHQRGMYLVSDSFVWQLWSGEMCNGAEWLRPICVRTIPCLLSPVGMLCVCNDNIIRFPSRVLKVVYLQWLVSALSGLSLLSTRQKHGGGSSSSHFVVGFFVEWVPLFNKSLFWPWNEDHVTIGLKQFTNLVISKEFYTLFNVSLSSITARGSSFEDSFSSLDDANRRTHPHHLASAVMNKAFIHME